MTRGSTCREAFPVTWAGLGMLLLCGAAFWFQGVARLDLILLAGSVLLAALLVLLALATLGAALLLRRRPRPPAPPADLCCGTWGPTGFRAAPPRLLPFVTLQADWTGVDAEVRIDAGGEERIRPRRRALLDQVDRRLRAGDMLGLTASGWTEAGPARVRILPAPARLDPAAALLGRAAGEDLPDPRGGPLGDRVDQRKYGHGDPLRLLLWKAYARTRKAFVRIPEKALEPSPRVCAYLPADPLDGPPASLARTLLEGGLLGPGWRFGADGAEDAHTLEAALDALARSGSGAAGPGLAPFLSRAARDGYAACVLLLPGRRGAWVEAVGAALASAPLAVHAVFALEGWDPGRRPGWARLLLEPAGAPGADPGELLELHRRLVPPGSEATLVDVLSGDVLHNPWDYLNKRAGGAP